MAELNYEDFIDGMLQACMDEWEKNTRPTYACTVNDAILVNELATKKQTNTTPSCNIEKVTHFRCPGCNAPIKIPSNAIVGAKMTKNCEYCGNSLILDL